MNQLQTFNHPEFGGVRTVEKDGKPFFIGKDVADILGYSRPDHAIGNHVDTEDKLMYQIDTSGQNRQMLIINESGLYSLILSSKLPKAKEFKRWVTTEVLPSIRKSGTYMTNDAIERMLGDPDSFMKMIAAVKEEREKRVALEAQVMADKPKVLFADAVSASHTTILVGDLAKLLKQNGVDIGANRLFTWMRNNGYLVKRAGMDYNTPHTAVNGFGLVPCQGNRS